MSDLVLARPAAARSATAVLGAVSVCHLLNDLVQSLFIAAYPILKGNFDLSFSQLGLLTLSYQLTASLLQPVVGLVTDRRPQPWSLAIGMTCTMAGLLVLAEAGSYALLVAGAMLLGTGSSIFHPEASRIARLASGGAHGFAQSVFQVGGNAGSALGPLLVALVVLPHGQGSLAWFATVALAGVLILARLGLWHRAGRLGPDRAAAVRAADHGLGRNRVGRALTVLFCLIFAKHFYFACFTSFFVFFLMERFALGEAAAQYCYFAFLAATAAGTLLGGRIRDRIGRRRVIWASFVGAVPFALALPFTGLAVTLVCSLLAGAILASAFSAIVVYGQDLLPGRVGLVSGLFFGLAFGMAGVGAAVLGVLADHTSITFVYQVCAVLPLFGVLTHFLPRIDHPG